MTTIRDELAAALEPFAKWARGVRLCDQAAEVGYWTLDAEGREMLEQVNRDDLFCAADALARYRAQKTAEPDLVQALTLIAHSADEDGRDQIAPDMWQFCREQARAALARHAAERANNGWMPVTLDQRDGKSILGFVPHWQIIAEVWFAGGQWWMAARSNGKMGCPPPSHYIPLPAPPTGGDDA